MSNRRKAVAVLAGIAVFAAVSASAATLGGIETSDLGANSNDVAGQVDNGVTVSWTTAYDAVAGYYEVTGADLDTIDGGESIPATAEIKLALTDNSGALIDEFTSTDGGASWTQTGSASIPAYDVYGVSVVINGGTVTAAVTGTK